MKVLLSLFLTGCISFGGPPNATADEEEAALRKKLQEAIEEFRDHTKGKSDICPVHKIKMPVKDVPMQFGLLATSIPEFRKLKAAEFPFSEEFIAGGCVVTDDSLFPKTGKVFVCPQCVAGEARLRLPPSAHDSKTRIA